MKAEMVRAARGALGLSQTERAQRAGLHLQTIVGLERGENAPSSATLQKIRSVFERNGLEVSDYELRFVKKSTYEIESDRWYVDLLDDVLQRLMEYPDDKREVLVGFATNRTSDSLIVNKWRELREHGIKMRMLVCEGDTYLNGPENEYRYIPKQYFTNYVQLIYANRVGFSSRLHKKAIVIHDAILYDSMRKQFENFWSIGAKPTKSTADVRF